MIETKCLKCGKVFKCNADILCCKSFKSAKLRGKIMTCFCPQCIALNERKKYADCCKLLKEKVEFT